MARAPRLTLRALTRGDWPIVCDLFGQRGACGGCWCMWWRVPRGGALWDAAKGEPNRRAFRRLVRAGRVRGALAFDADGRPVGWCCVGPRADFPRLERTKALATAWDAATWSVVCFYIPAPWRRRGVASALLRQAVTIARNGGARRLEAYPVVPKADGAIPAAFAWTGVPALFERERFRRITPEDHPRPVYERRLRPSRLASRVAGA